MTVQNYQIVSKVPKTRKEKNFYNNASRSNQESIVVLVHDEAGHATTS